MEIYTTNQQFHNKNNNTSHITDGDIDDDGVISTIRYPTTNGDVKGKTSSGFMMDFSNKFDKKQRRFTQTSFATSVGINGLVNGMRENYDEFDPEPEKTRKTDVSDKSVDAPRRKDSSENGDSAAKPAGKFAGMALPISAGFTAIKEKISPTGLKLPPGLSKMKNSFTGSRKETASTYVAANLRRGSDVKSLVEDDGLWASEEQTTTEFPTHDVVSY